MRVEELSRGVVRLVRRRFSIRKRATSGQPLRNSTDGREIVVFARSRPCRHERRNIQRARRETPRTSWTGEPTERVDVAAYEPIRTATRDGSLLASAWSVLSTGRPAERSAGCLVVEFEEDGDEYVARLQERAIQAGSRTLRLDDGRPREIQAVRSAIRV